MGLNTRSSKLPANPVGLYWAWWNPFKRLIDWSQTYNVIFLFHAYPAQSEIDAGFVGGETGAVVLRKPGGTIGTNLNADIATCRARGQRIIVSVGGAGGATYIQTQARADAFVQSIKDINVGLGGSGTTAAFDGIDWNNFEATQISGQDTWMTYAGQQLKAYYGSDFLITSPPSCTNYLGQRTYDRSILAACYAGDALDWICPQYYDGSGNNTQAQVLDTSTFYNTAVTVNGQSVTIAQDHIGVGYRIEPTYQYGWSATDAATAYSALVSGGYNPKGGFNWAAHLDTGETFATTVAAVMTNNTDPVVSNPAFTLDSSANVTTGLATTAQLTPPSGKTTGDFQAGYINEATNPHSTLDLASGKYTEMEYVITATADAVDAAEYEFRITYNGTSLDTYSVTPKLTVGTPPPAAADSPKTTGIATSTGISKLTL